MYLKMACMSRGIITLVAFIWFFSTVCFQMHHQIACMRGCILTLVAFVWPLSLATLCHSYGSPKPTLFTLKYFFLQDFDPSLPRIKGGKEGMYTWCQHFCCPMGTGSFKLKLSIVCGLKEKWKWNMYISVKGIFFFFGGGKMVYNKLASLEATLVRNSAHWLAYSLTGVRCRATSVAKNTLFTIRYTDTCSQFTQIQ